MKPILIRGAKQLLTLRGTRTARRAHAVRELGVIADGSVLVVDGLIREVGPTRRVENLALAREAEEIDATGRVVMPGFVDCHTHLLFPQFHLAGDGEDGGRGMQNLTARRIAHRAHGYLDAMARHGTTTIEAKTGCGIDETSEGKLLRAMEALNGDPIDIVPSLVARLDGSTEEIAARVDWYRSHWLPKNRQRRSARWLDLYWRPAVETRPHAERLLAQARELGYSVRIHNESSQCREAVLLGLAAGVNSLDHLEHASPEDIALLAASDTVAVLQPPRAFHRHDGRYAPARQLVDAGAAVALGSDFNPCLIPTLSMTTAISLACSRMQLTPAEAICAATANAAAALECSARVGSLECGKLADLVMLELGDYRDLAHHFGHNLVSLTMKRGTVIYQQGGVLRRANLRPVA